MKAFFLNGYFKLPDDFKGNTSDALNLLANYLRQNEIKRTEASESVSKAIDECQDYLYPMFIEAVLEKGKSFRAVHGIFETDEKGNFIKQLD